MFQHIKIPKGMDLTPREQALYALTAAYLSIPNFQAPKGGLKSPLMKRSTNGIETFNNNWQSLQRKGYLKLLRISLAHQMFRMRYELRCQPDDLPPIRTLPKAELTAYLQTNPPMYAAPDTRYLIVSRSMVVDKQLSLEAKWLWIVMYDQLDLFDKGLLTDTTGAPLPYVSKDDLFAASGMTKYMFDKAWVSLKRTGYLHTTRFFDSQYGVTRFEYTIAPKPDAEEPVTQIDDRRRNKLEDCLPAVQPYSAIDRQPQPAEPELDYAAIETVVKRNIQYTDLLRFVDVQQPDGFVYDKAALDQVVARMISAICTVTPTLPVNGRLVPAQLVRERLLTLDCNHVMAAMRGLQQAAEDARIRNPRAYLLTVLFNAPENA